ncbi:MAG: FAD-dependent oxidoreductase [Aromatoleum sp.]|nr:FAD-dependent oxidoreductase [Aromatoleum sp.]
MARPEFDLAVIGGGSGGLVVAAGGAALGAKVALVEKDKLGGDCLWTGCVPSKTLIESARVAFQMRNANRWALTAHDPKPDLAAVMKRVARVIEGIEPNDSPERFRSLGVDVIIGHGQFVGRDAFEVNGRRLIARSFVIATGSRPATLPLPGLDGVPYLTNETVFTLRERVPHLIVLGAGPIGSELAQAFRRLGSEVSVVDIAPVILPREDADLAGVVFRQMQAEGVRYHLGASAAQVERTVSGLRLLIRDNQGTPRPIDATHLLIAVGRKVNVEGLGLDAAGVEVDQGRIVLREGLQTTNRNVYVVGDVAGGYQFTHLAEHHAGIVLRQTIFRMTWAKPAAVIPWCTFTDPELARVGLSETEARKSGVAHRVYRFPFADIDRARAGGETEGMAKIVTSPRGKLLGAAVVGSHAGEIIAEYALALSQGLSASDLSDTIHVYPTLAQINRRVADQRRNEGLTPAAKKWIRRIFRLRGS